MRVSFNTTEKHDDMAAAKISCKANEQQCKKVEKESRNYFSSILHYNLKSLSNRPFFNLTLKTAAFFFFFLNLPFILFKNETKTEKSICTFQLRCLKPVKIPFNNCAVTLLSTLSKRKGLHLHYLRREREN